MGDEPLLVAEVFAVERDELQQIHDAALRGQILISP